MIGDGINDSPSLAKADVGVCINSNLDITIGAAGIILMKNDLFGLVTALDLGVKTVKRIKFNFIWAFLYNVALIPVAAGLFYGINEFTLSPLIAASAMALSSVSVVLSSLILKSYKPPKLEQKQKAHKKSRKVVPQNPEMIDDDKKGLTTRVADNKELNV